MAQASIWQPIFLEQLRKTGNVSEAAEAAGINRTTAYKARKRESEAAKEFAEAWDDAIEEACDRLEREAWRRAVEGVDKPVFQGGREVGRITEYSDTLLIVLLNAHRPDKYRRKQAVELTGKDGGPISMAAKVVFFIPDNGRDSDQTPEGAADGVSGDSG